MGITRTTIGTTFSILLYRVLLDAVYFNVISPLYEYSGFYDLRTSDNFILSLVLLVLSLPLAISIINNGNERLSSLIVSIIYLVSFIPFTTCVYAGIFADSTFVYFNAIYWLCLLVATILFLQKDVSHRPIRVYYFNDTINDKIVKIIGIISLITVLLISWKYTGFRLNFDLYGVYDLRAEAKKYDLPVILSYLLAWTGSVNPILMGYCLLNKRKLMALFFFFVQMISFGIAGSKQAFFAPIFVIFFMGFCKNMSFRNIKKMLVRCTILVSFLATIESMAFSTSYLAGILIRRMFFIPNQISYWCFDFFSINEFDFFRGSFLRHFGFTSPYPDGIAIMLAKNYESGGYANNGLFSDAFTNLGYVGIILMPILLALALYFFDYCSFNINIRLMTVVAVIFSGFLLSTFLSTALLTNGLLVICLILMLLGRNKKVKDGEKT